MPDKNGVDALREVPADSTDDLELMVVRRLGEVADDAGQLVLTGTRPGGEPTVLAVVR